MLDPTHEIVMYSSNFRGVTYVVTKANVAKPTRREKEDPAKVERYEQRVLQLAQEPFWPETTFETVLSFLETYGTFYMPNILSFFDNREKKWLMKRHFYYRAVTVSTAVKFCGRDNIHRLIVIWVMASASHAAVTEFVGHANVIVVRPQVVHVFEPHLGATEPYLRVTRAFLEQLGLPSQLETGDQYGPFDGRCMEHCRQYLLRNRDRFLQY